MYRINNASKLDWMLLNLPTNATRLFLRLCSLMKGDNVLIIKQTALADDLGIGRNTVQRNMYALRKMGAISFKSIRFGVRVEINKDIVS